MFAPLRLTAGSVKYVRTATIDQPILDKKGDNISIDWGYLYIPNINGNVSLGDETEIRSTFVSNLDYSLSGRWTKPFAAHDIGTYPIADGQVYGGDMPLEESGNILSLCAQIAKQEGNADYVKPYWDILKVWADYLVENGQDPANQLCTDDFAGHWAHNANLSIKAIMGDAAFAELAKLRGDNDTYGKVVFKQNNRQNHEEINSTTFRICFYSRCLGC